MWHYLRIEDPSEAFRLSASMMEATATAYKLANNREIAMFSQIDFRTGATNYHFTPDAASVARTFGATPCAKPTRAEAGGLAVGDQTIVGRLWPRQPPKGG